MSQTIQNKFIQDTLLEYYPGSIIFDEQPLDDTKHIVTFYLETPFSWSDIISNTDYFISIHIPLYIILGFYIQNDEVSMYLIEK